MKFRYIVSDEFKAECKSNLATSRQGKIHIVEDDIDITGENYEGELVDFTIEDNCYVNDKFIGTTVAKKITVNIINPDNSINLEDKEIEAFAGINNEYVPFGNFIIQKPENEEVKERTSFTGYDYMIKFNKKYEDRVTYPVKTTVLFQDVCNQAGLEAGNIEFPNSEYLIIGNPFTNNEDCRTVLSNIAQLAGGFAKIGRDNKVYIKSLKAVLSNLLEVKDIHSMTVAELDLTELNLLYGGKDDADENIDGNNYFSDFSMNEKWGEVNSLILSISGTEGENTTVQDDESIEKNGLTEVKIEDNYFLINQQARENVIGNLWDVFRGLNYVPFKTQYYGFPYLDTGDLIYVSDSKENGHLSYVLNHTFKYNGTFDGQLDTPAMTKTQTAYKNLIDTKTKFKQTERKIDKINGIIEDIIEEQEEISHKLSQHTQDIDSITDTVSETLDFTKNVQGTNELLLDDSLDTNILSFVAKGENIDDSIKFSESLKFSPDLYPKFAGQNITLVIDSQSRANPSSNKREMYYEINPLNKYNDVSDEFVIEYDDETQLCNVKILRYINKNNNVYTIRETPIEEILDENIEVKMLKGTTYIYLKEYTNWEMEATYISSPNLNEYYASKVELTTQIRQTADMIELYASRKIDKTEFATYIRQNADAIQFAWNQISQYIQLEGIEGQATLNIYDENNSKLMSLNKDGEHFFESGQVIPFGEMGVQTVSQYDSESQQDVENQYIAFSVNGDYDTEISNGMAWGIKTQTDNKFYPILFIRNFSMGPQQSDASYGQLELSGCDLVLSGIGTGILSGGVKIFGDPSGSALYFIDAESSDNLLTINTDEIVYNEKTKQIEHYKSLKLLDNIEFFENQAGSHSLKLSDGNKYSLLTDDGNIQGYWLYINGEAWAKSYNNISTVDEKKDINKYSKNGLEQVLSTDIYNYRYKTDEDNAKMRIGAVIGDGYNTSEEIIASNGKGIDSYSMISIAYKAIQEQQEEIEELKKKDKQKDKIINDLITRIEKLEKGGK